MPAGQSRRDVEMECPWGGIVVVELHWRQARQSWVSGLGMVCRREVVENHESLRMGIVTEDEFSPPPKLHIWQIFKRPNWGALGVSHSHRRERLLVLGLDSWCGLGLGDEWHIMAPDLLAKATYINSRVHKPKIAQEI